MITSLIKSAILVIAMTASASAQWKERFPRHCIPLKNGNHLFLIWDENDHYSRDIKFYETHLTCDHRGPKSRRNLAELRLSPGTMDEIRQIQRGAQFIMIPAPTAEEYLKINPIIDFSLSTNRYLTLKYGHGFTQEIYRAWIMNRKQNTDVQARLSSFYNQFKNKSQAERNEDLRKNNPTRAVLLVAVGMNWKEVPDEDTQLYIHEFYKTVNALGIESKILHRERYGTVPENAAMFEEQIRSTLASGRDVVLYGLCKGAPELLAAAAKVINPYLDQERKQTRLPTGWGRIVGALFSSPMMGGTFYARGADQDLETFSQLKTFFDFIRFKDVGGILHSLPTVTPEFVKQWMADVYPRLPSDIRYLTMIGILGGNGLLEKDTTGMNFFMKMNRKYNFTAASNDGFIEYPGTELPHYLSAETATIVIKASHMIMDGEWNGIQMWNFDSRHAAYTGFMSYVLGN